MAARQGVAETRAWFAFPKACIAWAGELAAEEGIDVGRAGEGEWLVAHRPGHLDRLRAAAESAERPLGGAGK